jgi:hypothetical protein
MLRANVVTVNELVMTVWKLATFQEAMLLKDRYGEPERGGVNGSR